MAKSGARARTRAQKEAEGMREAGFGHMAEFMLKEAQRKLSDKKHPERIVATPQPLKSDPRSPGYVEEMGGDGRGDSWH